MKMHKRTQETLAQLSEVMWFRNVGASTSNAVISISSWAEAITSCSELSWENLLLEAQNQYFAQVWQRSKERARNWNMVVDIVKPYTEELIAQKTAIVVAQHQLPKTFIDIVRWDILHVALEAEFADIYPPGFFASQAYWYYEGHFPCGWKGNFPEGKLVVY